MSEETVSSKKNSEHKDASSQKFASSKNASSQRFLPEDRGAVAFRIQSGIWSKSA
jgi:hypothetical protein